MSVSQLGAELARDGVTVGLWAQDRSPIRNATSTGPPLLFRGSRRVRGSLLDYGMGGVIIHMMIYGVILGVLTNLTARSLREGKWLLLPVVLIALQMGFRTDGHYISDVTGASVIAAWMYLILPFSDRVLRPLSRPKYPVGLAIRSLRAPSTESRR